MYVRVFRTEFLGLDNSWGALSISLALSVPWPSVVLCPGLQASPLKVLSVSGDSATSRGAAVKITNKHINMNL